MTGSSRDIDEESGDWDTVDINVEITADTDNDSLDWDTVDTDSEHDGVQDNDYDPPIMTDPRARL
ncbi:hypothetical protein PISMIDRAFT_6619 [Pisolithus microcarpus 441]|uniref:Uncharacterized protein n=1 Tax=Pisolithus microcarpus 441 TaxID=765257 RepID=A0A0D0ACN9_9AGAM|nr:hypothetical protein PISMIDRAFT_6619 [Pisolithus microcarpus 441]